jgi:hypothetical protein
MAGGGMYEQSQAFLDWAASYEDGGLDMRNRQRHEEWLNTLPCPIVRIEGEYTIEEQLDVLMVELQQDEPFSLIRHLIANGSSTRHGLSDTAIPPGSDSTLQIVSVRLSSLIHLALEP